MMPVMSRAATQTLRLAACAAQLRSAAREVLLIPDGAFRSRDGRPAGIDAWLLDAETGRELARRVNARRSAIVIDYEHQTLAATANGQPAPAAAWFTTVEYRPGQGLVATDVEWTARARALIEADEYRYISPVFLYDHEGRVSDLLHAGLTNDPGLDLLPGVAEQAAARFQGVAAMANKLGGMLARLMDEKGVSTAQMAEAAGIDDGTVNQILRGDIERPPRRRLEGFARVLDVSVESLEGALPAEDRQEATTVDRDELIKTLGLAAEATDTQITQALAALKAAADKAAELETQVAALKQGAGQPDPTQYAPVAVVNELRDQVAALRAESTTREVDSLVQAGIDAGQLTSKEHIDWARALGGKDIAALRSYLDTAPAVAALKGTQTGGRAPGADDPNALTDTQLAVCRAMGLSEDDYRKTLAKAQ